MMFSNKSKILDAKQKIEIFKQDKKNIADFIIKFKVLMIKTETDDLYTILKKNIQTDIIKTILGYPLMAVSKTLREQKVAIISVEQEYEFMESQQKQE